MTDSATLTPALEDYLESVYQLVEKNKVARVRDIASLRNVKPGSVSPAMRRLAELGLVQYVQREFVDLTPAGEAAARRIYARHQVLYRFLHRVLQLSQDAAEQEACALEHSLSSAAMDRMVSLFEFMESCPRGRTDFLDRFHQCPMVNDSVEGCQEGCQTRSERRTGQNAMVSVHELVPGQHGIVTHIGSQGAVRQRLLNMGLLPGSEIVLERFAPAGDPVWIRLGSSQIALRRSEAEALQVRPQPLVV